MIKNILKTKTGFTIIETMISIALFTVIVTIGMNSLLNASAVHQKSQDQRSIMDSLSFIMEDMSRNLRTGKDFNCTTASSPNAGDPAQSCMGGARTLIFTNQDGSKWAYQFISNGTGYDIYKSKDGLLTSSMLNPDSGSTSKIIFDSSSGFFVTGAEPYVSGGINQQPLATIILS